MINKWRIDQVECETSGNMIIDCTELWDILKLLGSISCLDRKMVD